MYSSYFIAIDSDGDGSGRCFNAVSCNSPFDSFNPQNGVSSFLLATMNGHVDVMQTLLQHGATVDLKKNVSAKLILKRSKLLNLNLSYIIFSLKRFYII